jgi:S-adenosylmethionine:tRNA ribosyltransferase-isomerase
MHEERYFISQKTYCILQKARLENKKIVAVGTTACRVLETVATTQELKGTTNIFIYPGYHFKMTDAIITNFHLPRSTLLMLVCAFGGRELIMRVYREAIERRYRFYSYGDCMLII